MRSDEEDDEDEYYDENEEEDEDNMDGGHAMNADEEDGDGDDDAGDGSDDEGSDEDNADEEGDEGEDEEEDEDEDAEVDVEGDIDVDAEEDDEDGEGEGDADEEDDEEDHEQDGSTEDEADDGDVAMDGGEDEGGSSRSISLKPVTEQPEPPHLARRKLFLPPAHSPARTLSIEAIVGIPLPSAVHSLASTMCMSYLLAGSQDGYVRAYDLWGSVNGAQMMTAQQRSVVGLGETVNKAGVGRGWWANEVDGIVGGSVAKRSEPVYSMACESDGLWALAGTQSGPINLHTLRHSPGHLVHSLKGHSSVVSCMTLLPSEKGFLSGSWDGTVREWDLNTGQTVRTYPTHGAQLSSIALRPFSHPASPSPSPRPAEDEDEAEDGTGAKMDVSVHVGPDFFAAGDKEDEHAADAVIPASTTATADEQAAASASAEDTVSKEEAQINGNDIEMGDDKSSGSMDSLFGGDDDDDLDAAGETAPPSVVPTTAPTPSAGEDTKPPSAGPGAAKPLGLALPGQPRPLAPAPAPSTLPAIREPGSSNQPTPSSSSAPLFVPQSAGPSARPSAGAAANIPLLSPTSYRAFSDDVLLTSSMDGQVVLIDRRVPSEEGSGLGVGRLQPGERAPPWCMSAGWLSNGNQVLAGRRNGTIDIWDVRRSSSSSSPNLLRTLRTPAESGPVSCVVAFPDGRHVATASQDNVRLWNTAEYFEPDDSIRKSRSKPSFKIIAGHHGGTISSMIIDPTGKFLITASGDRGWQGESTKVVLIHEVKW
ncbi:hypothetical protein IAU60_004394 [Kwoniella sp. DSM 27419]